MQRAWSIAVKAGVDVVHDTGLCTLCAPPGLLFSHRRDDGVTGRQMGFWSIPQIGTGVWVEFEQGDPDYPIWTGCYYGSAAEVPAGNGNRSAAAEVTDHRLAAARVGREPLR